MLGQGYISNGIIHQCLIIYGVDMKVYVKYLAAVSDYTGVDEEVIELGDGATLNDLLSLIRDRHPNIRRIEERFPLLILVNGVNSRLDLKLRDGDRVALLPPVSGGGWYG